MSPEALILQPKVTEVRAGDLEMPVGRVFPPSGWRVPTELVRWLVQLGCLPTTGLGVALVNIVPDKNRRLFLKYFVCNIEAYKGYGHV